MWVQFPIRLPKRRLIFSCFQQLCKCYETSVYNERTVNLTLYDNKGKLCPIKANKSKIGFDYMIPELLSPEFLNSKESLICSVCKKEFKPDDDTKCIISG